jgi:hypothetical protein
MDVRSFSVDFDDRPAVQEANQQLARRLQEFNREHKDRISVRRMNRLRFGTEGRGSGALSDQKDRFAACCAIYGTDLDLLYHDIAGDPEKKYYVYAHLNTSLNPIKVRVNAVKMFAATLRMDYLPFYIGKGTGDRWEGGDRSAAYRHMAKRISLLGKEIKKIKIKEGLSEIEALQTEAKLIDIFGLTAYGGFLVNLDQGHKSDIRISQYYPQEYACLRKMNSGLVAEVDHARNTI